VLSRSAAEEVGSAEGVAPRGSSLGRAAAHPQGVSLFVVFQLLGLLFYSVGFSAVRGGV
jgi:hypothetical protein